MALNWSEIIGPDIPVLETLFRATVMYFALLLLMRISKRQGGELGMADVLVIVVLADAAQNAIAGEYNSIASGILVVSTIIFWDYMIDWITYRFPVFDRFMKPQTVCLVKNGRMQIKGMRDEMVTKDELMEQIRLQGFDTIKKVKRAHIETNGKISVIPFKN